MTEDYRAAAQIDLDAVAFNIQSIQKKTKRRIIGLVKADAYGHGAVQVSRVLKEQGVDFFAVALVEEALQLRRAGITDPILVLDYLAESQAQTAVEQGLRFSVFSRRAAQMASRAAMAVGKPAYVHIKLDTGMGRQGFLNDEAVDAAEWVSRLPGLVLEGLFTHLSTADEADKTFAQTQLQRFTAIRDALSAKGIVFSMTHCANSAGVMDFPELPFDAVRPGIILYGIYPSDQVHRENLPLKPVMGLSSRVAHIKTIPAGTPIGYGRSFVTERESVIVTVPIGYADGIDRRAQKGGRVLLHGQAVPIVGRVCMDQCMVDATGIPDVTVGDEVVFFGRQGRAEITAEDVARVWGTIPYEVTCAVSKRVPRFYYQDGQLTETVAYV